MNTCVIVTVVERCTPEGVLVFSYRVLRDFTQLIESMFIFGAETEQLVERLD